MYAPTAQESVDGTHGGPHTRIWHTHSTGKIARGLTDTHTCVNGARGCMHTLGNALKLPRAGSGLAAAQSHANVHKSTHTHCSKCSCARVHSHLHAHLCMLAHTHIYINTYERSHMHVPVNTYARTCTSATSGRSLRLARMHDMKESTCRECTLELRMLRAGGVATGGSTRTDSAGQGAVWAWSSMRHSWWSMARDGQIWSNQNAKEALQRLK